MKWSGWLFLILSWSVIIWFLAYSLHRTLRSEKQVPPEDGRKEPLP